MTKTPSRKKLVMSFDPNTIEHLGIKMYSSLPTAVAELIANAYDADAKKVMIKLVDNAKNKEIVVTDNGIGMSFVDINNFFLKIGRNRRKDGYVKTPGGRKATGKKGLGKLAFFGIGDTIEVSTIAKKSGVKTKFILDWNDLISTRARPYEPKYITKRCNKKLHGTEIRLKNLKLKTNFDKQELAIGISKLFNFIDSKFKVVIRLNNERPFNVDNKLKYTNINPEFRWSFPARNVFIDSAYEYRKFFKGRLISTEKPLKPDLRGITLYANGRLINVPEFFGASESSHFFSYLTGWFDVDFVDDWKEDVISTNRQSLNWDLDKPKKLKQILRDCLTKIERDWRKKRREKRRKEIKLKTNVDISKWYGALPDEVLNRIRPLIDIIIDKSELAEDDQSSAVNNIHSLVPEYPYLHWRHLHGTVQKASMSDYTKRDYYRAFIEAAKKYINDVRSKTGSTNSSDSGMMGEVFGRSSSKLSVTKKYKKKDGSDFQQSTKDSIEDGQKFLSMGILSGHRNPLSHEEISQLRESDMFSEKDCLDGLSLLSHLFKRLENAEII
jgi:uncharacterized protein (TIGR02391 family)